MNAILSIRTQGHISTIAVMMRKINANLGIKLFLFLTIIIILAVVPLSYTAIVNLIEYGSDVSSANEQQIRFQAISNLKKITRERADRYQEYFNRIESSVALLGRQASTIYSNIDFYSASPLYTPNLQYSAKNDIRISDINEPVISLFWGDKAEETKSKKELLALTHLQPMLQQVLEDNTEVVSSHSIMASDLGQYSSKNMLNRKALYILPPTSIFNLIDGEPVNIFTKTEKGDYNVNWSNIYKNNIIRRLMITACAPIYDGDGELRGITGIDLPLDNLVEETLSYDKNQPNTMVQFSFLLDEKGRIIALPEEYYPLLGLTLNRQPLPSARNYLYTSLFYSTKREVLNYAFDLEEKSDNYAELTLAGEDYLLVSSRMNKLGWVLGVAVKESDLLFSVEGSRQALKMTVNNLVEKGVMLTLVTVAISLFIIYTLIKYLIRPLRNLADATQRVASGDLTVRSPVTTKDEAGVLAQSFNSMVEKLQLIQDEQERYAESLKLEVIRRNLELVSKRNELEKTLELLNIEIERREIIADALRYSQQQYSENLQSFASGIYILEDGRLTYTNTAFAEILFKTTKEELEFSDPLELIFIDDRELVRKNIQLSLEGKELPPYTVKCLRNDGRAFFGEIWSMLTSWQGKKVLVGRIFDMSSIKQSEEKLQIQDQQLKQSLEEKEILLKEIYHRTKNNMLVIISMLDLQAQDIDDENLKLVFQEIENRIRTMALVHEKLYQSRNLSEIDMGTYLKDVASSLLATMVFDNRISLRDKITPIEINIDYAVPLGLVVNEIVTNSIKHGFPNNRKGVISIETKRDEEGKILLIVADDGIGLPSEIDIANNTSFGLGIIITSLVKMQLKGEIEVDCTKGTQYLISFPEPKAAKRI